MTRKNIEYWMRGAGVGLWLLPLTAAIAAQGDPYSFDWSNTSNGRTRRVAVSCSLKECSGKVFDNKNVLFSGPLPVDETTAKIRQVQTQLGQVPACGKPRKAHGVERGTLSWKVRYFGASAAGSASSAEMTCVASDMTAQQAQAFIDAISKASKGR